MSKKILFSVIQGYVLDADDLSEDEIEEIIDLIHDNDFDREYTGIDSGTFHIINNAKCTHFEAQAWEDN